MVELPAPLVPVRVIFTKAKDAEAGCPVHINMHGGGFVQKQSEQDDLYCAHVAAEIHGIVVDIDYAVSLDHPFPMGFDQSYEITKLVAEQCAHWGGDPRKLSIGGHSAGGCLAAAIALKAAKTKDFQLCLQVLDYAATESYSSVAKDDEINFSKVFGLLYADGDVELLKNPYVSPYYASDEELIDQPKTVIVGPKMCPFYTVNIEFGRRLVEAGTEVNFKTFANSPHGFTIHLNGEWREAQDYIIQAILDASR